MSRTDEIRLIPDFTGQTADVGESDLKLRSSYWVYTTSIGGGLVDEFTVRDFLDNPNNEKISIDFFNYLQLNFSKSEFNELYYNNIKLSNTLNDYYNRTIGSNLPPTTNVAKLQLTATTAITYTNTNFVDYSNRSTKKISVVVEYNTGDSYYITVPISSSYNILDNPNYDKYRKNSLGSIQTYTNAESFRYVVKKGQTVSTPDINVVRENSFDDFVAKLPIPLNVPEIKIQFKKNKYILSKSNPETVIPIEIVFDKPSSFEGQSFQITLGPDLVGFVDPTWVSFADKTKPYHEHHKFFTIISGQTGITTNIYINNSFVFQQQSDLKIEVVFWTVGNPLNLSYVVSNGSFFVQTELPLINQTTEDLSYDYVKEGTKLRPQVLLQSFVDLKFDDSESEFYRNKNMNVLPTVIP